MLPETISVLRNNAIFAMIIQVISSVTGLLFFMIRRVKILFLGLFLYRNLSYFLFLEIIGVFYKYFELIFIFIVLFLPDNKFNLIGSNLRGHERCNIHEEIPDTFPRVINNRSNRHFLRLLDNRSLFHSRRCITILN